MTERRKRVARDYGPTTSVLLANQQFKYERLLETANTKLFQLNSELWKVRRELKAALRQLELSHAVTEKRSVPWHDDHETE